MVPRDRLAHERSGGRIRGEIVRRGARTGRYTDGMEHDASLARTGSLAAFGVAAAYLASAGFAGLMPAALQGRPDVTAHEFWTVLSQQPHAHLAFHWAWVAAGFCGLAAVPAISRLVFSASPGAVLWSSGAAWLGFATLARSHLMEVAFDRKVIPHYLSATPAYQEAVHVVAGLALDVPDGVLTYGAIGAWVTCVSALGLRSRRLPRALCGLGFAVGATLLAGVLGYGLPLRPLIVLAVGLGGALLVPAWFTGIGLVLRRVAR
jgi:hypothetical protein